MRARGRCSDTVQRAWDIRFESGRIIYCSLLYFVFWSSSVVWTAFGWILTYSYITSIRWRRTGCLCRGSIRQVWQTFVIGWAQTASCQISQHCTITLYNRAVSAASQCAPSAMSERLLLKSFQHVVAPRIRCFFLNHVWDSTVLRTDMTAMFLLM